MLRFLINILISLVMAALGLLICMWTLNGFSISASGFVIAVIVFTVAQAIFAPFIFNVARKYASAMLGGIGLISTFVALLIASFFPGGIQISGIITWVLATLIVWIVTALGTWLLPLLFFKKKVEAAR
ncbi:phage holin family protein [Microbacterium sp. H1-D42]|uniref:phage holin family protein n=1 Tax=Microbacterium sp. H1-D42 TaxID=2925844 RepID=UPI001F53490D|nr:phage holin family protein [Microbacterium sp. H1-D42]UNK70209.1 phage holin family protein [Microbacterium sp. H1-D42]